MSTERRRSAEGGRRRADGPVDGPHGDGGDWDGVPPGAERSGRRRRPEAGEENGFWGGEEQPPERPRRRRPPEGEPPPGDGRRRRPPEGHRRRPPEDGERPRRRRPDAETAAHGAEGERPRRRRPDDPRAGGRRRADGPRDPRERDRTHAAGAEGRRRPPGRGDGGGGRGGRRRSAAGDDDRPWWKRFFAKAWKPALAVFGLLIIAGVGTFAVFYSVAPDADDLDAQAEVQLSATQIMWAGEEDGEENVALTTGEVNRVPVEFEDIPDSVVSGVLAAEQHTFYDDPGVSITGTARALLSRGEAGGGSTITQQMARNYYGGLSQEQTIQRKVREIFISIKLGQQLEQDQILEQYLNTIYFGRNASGVEAAAQAYFDKPVSELDDAEGALIGLIIQQPSAFSNPEPGGPHDQVMRGERWDYLKTQLGALNDLEPDLGLPQEEAQNLEFPDTVEYNPEEEGDPQLAYINNAVVDEIERRYDNITGADIATQGYTIRTSLDEELMGAAEDAFDVLPEMADDTMRGLTSVNPETGEIVAFNGGPNAAEVVNNSLTHQTQAGSAYKPFVLAAALRDGTSLNSQFDGDSPQEFPGLESPVQNAGERSYGEVDLIQSTADSINTPYVELMVNTGVENVDDLAVDMGVNPARTETSVQGPLVALGTHQVNTLDMASAYATFAAQGQQKPAHMVTEVRDRNGDVVEPNDADEIESGTEVLDSDVTADATHAMTQVVEDGGGENAALPDGRPVAGKTGTSSDAVSAWFVGYTPQLATSVSLSRAGAEPLQISGEGDVEIFGGTTSANVWSEFMTTAMEGEEVQEFPPPQFIGEDQSFLPTPEPTPEPTEEPSEEPTPEPTEEPSEEPTPPEDCEWWDTECEQEEIDCEDPQFEGHPECQEDGEEEDGEDDGGLFPNPGEEEEDTRDSSLVRPQRE